jgi:lipopolysaccharide export system protein LptA
LRIEGDTITFFFDDDKNITKAIAQGKLAKYQQIQKEGEKPVKARAIQMEYYADRQKIYLIGEGHIIQNGDEFTGNTIQYDIAKGLITANSQPVTVAGETKAKQRLHFTFQPPKKSGSSSKPSKPKAVAPAPAVEPTPAPEKEAVTSAAPAPKTYPTALTTSRLNVRSGPGTHYLKLGTLDQGAQVNVLTRQPNWVQVRGIIDGEPVIGWVNGQYLQ